MCPGSRRRLVVYIRVSGTVQLYSKEAVTVAHNYKLIDRIFTGSGNTQHIGTCTVRVSVPVFTGVMWSMVPQPKGCDSTVTECHDLSFG